jgi:D-alanyl-D-alanine-carboxypeptidase/D-alanyl-D-alanine-endopeptidase
MVARRGARLPSVPRLPERRGPLPPLRENWGTTMNEEEIRDALLEDHQPLAAGNAQSGVCPRTPEAPSHESIRRSVESLSPAFRRAPVAVGWIEGTREITGAFGRTLTGAIDEGTTFDLGGVSELFTALLLAEMCERREVGLDDRLSAHLPADLRLAIGLTGRQTSLADCATHATALPYLPEELGSGDFSRRDHVTALEQVLPAQERGPSPWGVALLGLALAHRAGKPYGALLRERVLEPLGMRHTHLSSERKVFGIHAAGYDWNGAETPRPGLATDFDPCRGVRSSLRDLMRFARAHIDPGPLQRCARTTLVPRFAGPLPGQLMGLAWHGDADSVHRKSGQSRGSRCHLEIDRVSRRALVVVAAHHSFPVTELVAAFTP